MKIGITATATDNLDDCLLLGRLAEARGFESVWFGEHSHLPTSEGHAFVEKMPEFYRRIPDPYLVLAALAATTTRIRLGTSIALPAQGDSLTLAKQTATLDQLSGGRFEWGVGYGWNHTEMRDHGLDPKFRMATFGETVAGVRQIWENEIASFNGNYVQFGECWSYPKPVQKPHPPILLGCRPSPRAFAQLVEHCDGWLPSVEQGLDGAEESVAQLRRMFSEAGREPDTLKLSYIDSRGFWLDVDVDTYRSKRRVKADVVRRLRDLGADRLIVGVPLYRTEAIEPMLDAAAELWSVAEE